MNKEKINFTSSCAPGVPYMKNMIFIPANMPGSQMMSNINFIPANLPGVPYMNNSKHKQFKLSWWEENSFYYYPYMLISAFYGIQHKDFRKKFNISDDFIIIGDSGGFQNMTQNANLNKLNVLRWQEENCQIGLTFDEPILGNDSEKIKLKKQINTVKNAYYALDNKKKKDFKLYAVFQGHSLDEQKTIHDAYKEEGDITKFDGFAIGGMVPIAGNTCLITKILLTFIDNVKQYKKPLHFFGISGNKLLPLLIYLQLKLNIPITFDSSSFGGGAIRREFLFENNKLFFGRNKNHNLKEIPCNCPVCKLCLIDDFESKDSKSGGLISLHNLYKIIYNIEKLKSLSTDINLFKDYIKKNYPEKVNMLIDYIDEYFENGLLLANEKFKFKLKINDTKKSTQNKLFDF